MKSLIENASEVKNKVREVSKKARQSLLEGGSSHTAFGYLISRWLVNKV